MLPKDSFVKKITPNADSGIQNAYICDMRITKAIILTFLASMVLSCAPGDFRQVEGYPEIFPDYVGTMVPASMAGLRFAMADGRECKVSQRIEDDVIWYKVSAWLKGAKSGETFKEFPVYISNDPIDPYIAYRLIEPSYESWHDMGLYQRELGSYKESAIVTNKANGKGCVNCHTFQSGNPDRMLFHARGKNGGTVFVNALQSASGSVRKINLAETGPGMQGTYPAWNPDGRYVVFSSNSTNQSFYTAAHQPIEVYDKVADMILMDLETENVSVVIKSDDSLVTFPTWSEDGKKLYYCVSDNPGNLPFSREELRYKLVSLDFENGSFVGEAQTVLDVDSLSISFPRIKGDKLIFTASAYGTFPIWHQEADLWMMDLADGSFRPLDEINSEETDSYHSWSSNGKWIVFSSRRGDGRYTRLYFSHFNEDGTFSKPFLLPQSDPMHNTLRLKSYNIPEFVSGKVKNIEKEVSKLF